MFIYPVSIEHLLFAQSYANYWDYTVNQGEKVLLLPE